MRVIYGEDNRKDIYEWKDPYWQLLAYSTASMIKSWKLEHFPESGHYSLYYDQWDELNYCPTERFIGQPMAASCSGFLVASDLLVTAGHCVSSDYECDYYYWAFDYHMEAAGVFQKNISEKNLYRCVQIIEAINSYDNDYALLRLDRKVPDREPLIFRREGSLQEGNELIVIGNPQGLPTKIADGAWVRDNSPPHYFVTNLDTYYGNSGSAVLNAQTGIVEGILVRGETDFKYDSQKQCRASKVCGDAECSGEDVTRITNIQHLKQIGL